MGHDFKSLGSVGGAGSSAKAGGYSAGPQIAAQGNYSGGPECATHKDLRGDVPHKGEYKQGPTVTAQTGGAKPGSSGDLRSANAKSGGYNQGNQFGAKGK